MNLLLIVLIIIILVLFVVASILFAFAIIVKKSTNIKDAVATFEKFSKYPYGKTLYSWAIGFISPYSGSISPIIENLTYSSTKVIVNETRALRNPFGSIHAAALVNLGELACGIVVLSALTQKNKRGIPTGLKATYIKKARGKITAVVGGVKISDEATQYTCEANIYDSNSECVCSITVDFTISGISDTKKAK